MTDLVVCDLEATCWSEGAFRERMEIIEIGAVRVDGTSFAPLGEFAAFVRPVAEPVLSDFCRELTSIRQADVDAAAPFPEVFAGFLAWIGDGPFRFASWGAYDLRQLRQDCARHGLTLPAAFEDHVNLKHAFAARTGTRPAGMARALARAGLPLNGRHHRGIDDARNIARLVPYSLG